MFKSIYDVLEAEISGEIALNFVKEITRHHRIQASAGLWDAVNYVVETLQGYGLQTRIHSYPADGKEYFWSSLMFKEWSCRDAWLKLIEPEEKERFLARWDEAKISLIQRSYPTDGEIEADIVFLEDGTKEEDYRELDVEGKIVLTDSDVTRIHELAVERHSASGIIYYGTWVRPPTLKEGELDDALKYTSFWWAGNEKPAFGFVITPRTGRWLRDLVEENEDNLKVKAYVDSRIYEGNIENAVSTIQGLESEKIVIVSHICHPQPSANDNASGSAVAMEVARALKKLIDDGKLPKPRRSIIFTWVPEMTGTYAWLNEVERDIPEIAAALNLDMVGEKQDITGSSLIVERTPEATPSFVNSLMDAIYDEAKKQASNLGGSSEYPLFRHAVTPFSGGSDHYIYSDPTVGVPCPMIIQWPDKFWHTSYDTIDKVDPEMLKTVAVMTAVYAYLIASAGSSEATWIASETASREKKLLQEKIQNDIKDVLNIDEEVEKNIANRRKKLMEKVDYWTDRGVIAVKSVQSLSQDEELKKLVEEYASNIRSAAKVEEEMALKTIDEFCRAKGINLPRTGKSRKKKIEKQAEAIVPKRKHRGPPSLRPWVRNLSPEDRYKWRTLKEEHEEDRIITTLANYWADGERNLLEISELVEYESGKKDIEYLMDYYKWLEKMGLVELK